MILYRLPAAKLSYKFQGRTNTDVVIVISDIIGDGFHTDLSAFEARTSAAGILEIDLTPFRDYDRTLGIYIHDSEGELLEEKYIEIVRPYVAFNGDQRSDEAKEFYAKEAIARHTIDGITGGFYLRRKIVSYDSHGGDVIPVSENIVKIIRVWENGIKVFDALDSSFRTLRSFVLSQDRASIVIDGRGYVNRRPGRDATPKWAPSDYMYSTASSIDLSMPYYTGVFPSGHDYLFDIEIGYRYLPSDIAVATQLLMDTAGSNIHADRYITAYTTDQYSITYGPDALVGTGHRQVDMILSKYIGQSGAISPGVL